MIKKREILEVYTDELFGIPIEIRNCVIREETDKGRVLITIPDEEGLAAAAAMARALVPIKLSGDDIRMMRKTLGLKAKEFAEALDMNPTRLSHLEKTTDGLGHFTEANIRQYVCARLKARAPAIGYDPAEIVMMKAVNAPMPTLVFERVRLKMAESMTKSDEWDLAA
jgi:DNA-binding XRE family transcriptional regulator